MVLDSIMFQTHVKDVGLTQNQQTMTPQKLITFDLS